MSTSFPGQVDKKGDQTLKNQIQTTQNMQRSQLLHQTKKLPNPKLLRLCSPTSISLTNNSARSSIERYWQKKILLGIYRSYNVELLRSPCMVGLNPRKMRIFSLIWVNISAKEIHVLAVKAILLRMKFFTTENIYCRKDYTDNRYVYGD